MTRKTWALAAIATVGLLTALSMTPSASAFHGAWWFGTGTAKLGTQTFNAEFRWGGQKAVITCGGGGCLGEGDGFLRITSLPTVVTYPYAGVEDVRNIFFTSNAFCPGTLEVTPQYKLVYAGGALTGVQNNCLSSGINNNDFTGVFGPFTLAIHSEGPFGVAHG